jgi:hypothetical protein
MHDFRSHSTGNCQTHTWSIKPDKIFDAALRSWRGISVPPLCLERRGGKKEEVIAQKASHNVFYFCEKNICTFVDQE